MGYGWRFRGWGCGWDCSTVLTNLPSLLHVAVGMAGGLLSIKHREHGSDVAAHVAKTPRVGSYRHFVRGHDHTATAADVV